MKIRELFEKINHDITDRNWHAETTINLPKVGELILRGRNLSHIHPPQFTVEVFTPENKSIAYFRFLVLDWEKPKTGWFAPKPKKDPYVIGGNVSVWDEYQKKGIARAVYQWVKSLGNDIRPSTTQTAAGKSMWRSFEKNPLDEAFDRPYKGKWAKSDYGDVDVNVKLPNGTYLNIMFNQEFDGEHTVTQVEFHRNNSQDVTGEGDAQRIFATVLDAIQKYIKKYEPEKLSFSASKQIDMDADDVEHFNPESRAKLYTRLVQRYAGAWGYQAQVDDEGDIVIYQLTRQDLTENSFVNFMNKSLSTKVDKPPEDPLAHAPDFYKNAPVANAHIRPAFLKALKFGLSVLAKLDAETKQELLERGEHAICAYIDSVAERTGATGFREEDVYECQDDLANIFHDPTMHSWVDVLQQDVNETFLGEYPSIETTLGEAKYPDLVKYGSKEEKKLHRNIDISQGTGRNYAPADYDADEKDWHDLEHATDYTGGSYDTNDYLHRHYRKKSKAKELSQHQAKIQALDRLLANHKLPEQIVVYTGVKESPANAWKKYRADVKKPIRLHLPAYTSTTTKLRIALQHVADEVSQVSRKTHQPRNKDAPAEEWGSQILMITLPAGMPAASVKKISEYPGENEILLPRGMDIEIEPNPTVTRDADYVWHARVIGHNPVQIAAPMQENFADGRNPQDKGDSKRHHVPTKSSVSNLRKFAKSHSGRAAQLAHWMANMKSGRAKKK